MKNFRFLHKSAHERGWVPYWKGRNKLYVISGTYAKNQCELLCFFPQQKLSCVYVRLLLESNKIWKITKNYLLFALHITRFACFEPTSWHLSHFEFQLIYCLFWKKPIVCRFSWKQSGSFVFEWKSINFCLKYPNP